MFTCYYDAAFESLSDFELDLQDQIYGRKDYNKDKAEVADDEDGRLDDFNNTSNTETTTTLVASVVPTQPDGTSSGTAAALVPIVVSADSRWYQYDGRSNGDRLMQG